MQMHICLHVATPPSADNLFKWFVPRSGRTKQACLTLTVLVKEFFEKVNFETDNRNHAKISQNHHCQHQKPADQDLQCFQKRINPGSAGQGLYDNC